MSDILQQIKMACRDNVGATIFLMIVGIIAVLFIGYLLIDYFKMLAMNRRMKHRHRHESRSPQDEHRGG